MPVRYVVWLCRWFGAGGSVSALRPGMTPAWAVLYRLDAGAVPGMVAAMTPNSGNRQLYCSQALGYRGSGNHWGHLSSQAKSNHPLNPNGVGILTVAAQMRSTWLRYRNWRLGLWTEPSFNSPPEIGIFPVTSDGRMPSTRKRRGQAPPLPLSRLESRSYQVRTVANTKPWPLESTVLPTKPLEALPPAPNVLLAKSKPPWCWCAY
jgi:hypothetical protein